MAIAATGAVSMSDLRTEFVGGSAAISFSDLYRGGSNIRANAANNSSTNLAASVPTSGAINYTDFRSTAKGFRKTYTATATNQNASSVFGDDYSVNYPKEIVINSGVELGATGTGEEALQIDSGLSGTMTITNNGTLSGAGGSANGGAGGDAFEANVACTLINNGTIRAGGGGGGQGGSGGGGGNGGQGRTSSTSWGSWSGYSGFYDYNTIWLVDNGNSRLRLRWSGTFVLTQNGGDYQTATQKTVGNAQYQRGSLGNLRGLTTSVDASKLQAIPIITAVLVVAAALAALAVGVKATITANKMDRLGLVAQAVRLVELMQGLAEPAELAGPVETAEPTETAVVTVRQEPQATLAETETTVMAAEVLAVLVARQAAQPVSTYAACPMSHLRTMAQCKEAQPNAVQYS